jgi:sigma-E factor negative regulatory protein RseA|tara:strand:+ start:252 stop:848 length:597 start_codon:yes stop_codon:yes gene_type:complete
MTTDDNELLSALVDGELRGRELEKAMALLSADQSARECLQRYQICRDAFHGYGTKQQARATQKISAAIVLEAKHKPVNVQAVEKTNVISLPIRFWQQSLSLAVAASIGALAVVGVMTQPNIQTVPMAALESTQGLEPAEITVAASKAEALPLNSGNRWTVEEQEIEDRLNIYLVDHNEYAGVSDIFSNARVVAYESGQ